MGDSSTVPIRPEESGDEAAIATVLRRAFERDDEARLVDALRCGGEVELSLVAEANGQVVGHVLFSKLEILTPSGTVNALALAPLAVLPECQRQGIGSLLVRRGLALCTERGHSIVTVLGDPAYYQRFAFSAESAKNLHSPYSGDHYMALELRTGALAGLMGEVRYSAPFECL